MRKRIISIAAALSVIMAVFVPSAAVRAELGIKNELQVSFMAAMNIVPGYPASYDGEANVTAADFFKYAYRLIGLETGDLSSEIKSYGLEPDAKTVDSETAVKVILNLAGFDKIVGSYKNNYYLLAADMGMIKNTGISAGSSEPLTYDRMVMLFWNTLNMKAVRMISMTLYDFSEKTVMETYLKVYEGFGVVNANRDVSVDGGGTTGDGEIRIDNENYLVGNTVTEHLIGSNVRFYYYDDGIDKTIRWIDANTFRNKTLTVSGEDIISAGGDTVKYTEGEKTRSFKLDRDYLIIYNGRTVTDGSITIEAAMSANAYSRFIDNNNSGRYNIVVINDYEYYFIDAVSQNTINDYTTKTALDFSEADTLRIYENGAPISAEDIKTGTMAAVAKSIDSSVITIELLSGTVSGEITAKDRNGITVSGEKYPVSPSYAGDVLEIGKGGTFYFDNFGKIIRGFGLKEATSQYGYLLGFYNEDAFGGSCLAEIITAEGKREAFGVNSSVSLNEVKRRLGDVINLVGEKQLITYRVNSENKIIKINTPDNSYIGRDTSAREFSLHFKGAGKYRKNNMCFNSKYLLDYETPIFVVPNNGDIDDYTVMTASSLVNNVTYDISVYDIDDYMCASCIVLKENFAEPENLRSKRSVVITDVSYAVNDEGEDIISINGYQQGSKTSYALKNFEMKDNRGRYYVRDLQAGDVVQISVDVKGNVSAVQLLLKADEQKLAIAMGSDTPNKYWEGGNLVMPDLSLSFGKVTDRSASVLLVDADGNDAVVSKSPYKFSGTTNVYAYARGKVYPSAKNDILCGDTVYVQEYQGNLHEVLVFK